MVWQSFSCLAFSLAIPFAKLYFGGLSQVQWAARRWIREGEREGVSCLQSRVESAAECFQPADDRSSRGSESRPLWLVIRVNTCCILCKLFCRAKNYNRPRQREREEGRGREERHIGLSSAQRGLVMLK